MAEVPGPWNERWEVVKKLAKSGQGTTYLVKDRKATACEGALKVLNEQNSSERRSRLYREASGLKSLVGAAGIAQLLDTNADLFEDKTVQLYIVTQYIKGEYPKGPIAFADSIEIVLAILKTLDHCHKSGIIHRDIKPSNIILPIENQKSPILIDFGLSFNAVDRDGFSTAADNRLGPGNWFALPEMAAGAEGQRSAIMDVTHTLGLLFELLTGEHPKQLLDQESQKPHRRGKIQELLKKVSGEKNARLNEIFEIGFNVSISNRWESAAKLHDALKDLAFGNSRPDAFADDLRSFLNSYRNNPRRDIPDRLRHINGIFADECAKTVEKANQASDGGFEIGVIGTGGNPVQGHVFEANISTRARSRSDVKLDTTISVHFVAGDIASQLRIVHPYVLGEGTHRSRMSKEFKKESIPFSLAESDPRPIVIAVFQDAIRESVRLLFEFLNNEHAK